MVSSTSLIISGSSAEVGSSNSMICGSMVDEPVYNDLNDKIGSIDDVIVSPDRQATFAVVSVGGFLGMGKHYVAIPIDHFEIRDGNLFLAGATKEALKSVPSFVYNKLEKATKSRKVKAE
ncbi:PRC-barrel domain-containing protein [Paraburkholderia strydomiana]|uniref:PRC-barrel domain-containing protein n=1 Tax=Paraburkholderia strydomiana TaxID=1245417 RepID=UPI0038BC7AD5